MAKSMTEHGYSAAKIRAEVMKLLRADQKYMDAVAQNTKEHKAFVQGKIDEALKEAEQNGEMLIAEAANMAWNNDLSMWDMAGVDLKKPNNMSQLMTAFRLQTVNELKNLTRTTGFKNTAFACTPIQHIYQKEMDLALLKVATGTFSYDQAVNDSVHRLAQSGLRSIDYASGRSYQLDTAARMSVRTGLSQLSGKITEANIDQTGVKLVRTSQHAGSRPEHAPWQNKVFSYDGKNKKYPDFVSSTGYGTADGLKGVNCTHDFYPFWEGIDKLPEDIEDVAPVKINGKEYTYYQANQKQRSMERGIRATKREIEAQQNIGGETTQLRATLKAQMAEYKRFSAMAGIREKPNRLSVSRGSSDLKKTKAYKDAVRKANTSKASAISNANYPVNENATFELSINGISDTASNKLSKLAKQIVKDGHDNNKEYAYAVDRFSGEVISFEEGNCGECMSKLFFDDIQSKAKDSIVLLHNHTNNLGASYDDVNTILTTDSVYASVMACNNGNMYYAANQIKEFSGGSIYDLVFDLNESLVEKELRKLPDYDTIKANIGDLRNKRESVICKLILKEYFGEVYD